MTSLLILPYISLLKLPNYNYIWYRFFFDTSDIPCERFFPKSRTPKIEDFMASFRKKKNVKLRSDWRLALAPFRAVRHSRLRLAEKILCLSVVARPSHDIIPPWWASHARSCKAITFHRGRRSETTVSGPTSTILFVSLRKSLETFYRQTFLCPHSNHLSPFETRSM